MTTKLCKCFFFKAASGFSDKQDIDLEMEIIQSRHCLQTENFD